MRRFNILLNIVFLWMVSSCYEGEDLQNLYEESYTEPIIDDISVDAVQYTTVQIHFSLHNAKYDSQVCLYYTDNYTANVIQEGEKIIVASSSTDSITTGSYNVSLGNLFPNTKYRYCITYKDAGNNSLQTQVRTFDTKNFSISTELNRVDYFGANLTCYVYGVPFGAQYGIVVGRKKEVSLDDCIKNKVLGVRNGEGTNINFNIENLEPNTTYYYRDYVIYNERIIYPNSAKTIETPQVGIKFYTMSAYVQESQTVCLISKAVLQNRSSTNDSIISAFEYGFQISKDSSFNSYDSIMTTPDRSNRCIGYYSNLEQGQDYYARAFFRWPHYIEEYSKTVTFNVPTSE